MENCRELHHLTRTGPPLLATQLLLASAQLTWYFSYSILTSVLLLQYVKLLQYYNFYYYSIITTTYNVALILDIFPRIIHYRPYVAHPSEVSILDSSGPSVRSGPDFRDTHRKGLYGGGDTEASAWSRALATAWSRAC